MGRILLVIGFEILTGLVVVVNGYNQRQLTYGAGDCIIVDVY